MMKILTISVFLTLSMLSSIFPAEKIFCDQCGNLIKQGATYIKHLGKIYCDEECYDKTLPKCVVCGKIVKSGFIQSGKNYCSEKCLETTWDSCVLCGKRVRSGYNFGSKSGDFYCVDCSKKTVCFACGLPGDCSKLDDGRNICKKCSPTAITSHREAAETFREVRKMMKDKLGLYTLNEIDYRLVDNVFLEAKSQSKVMELGLYSQEQWKSTEIVTMKKLGFKIGEEVRETYTDSITIYILDHLPKDKFIEVAAHELAHDWMEDNYPDIKDDLIAEGWAEFTASKVNLIYGNGHLVKRMEENREPVYGEGFRYVSAYAEKHGMDGLFKMFRELNTKEKKKKGQ